MCKIVLTGTTGHLGSSVLRNILSKNLIPASNLIISLYNPKSIPEEILSLGIDIRRGDFNDPTSLRTAFQGADTLFLVSYPGFSGITDLRIKVHLAAINAAKEVGIKRVVYTSLSFGGVTGETSTAVVYHAHIETVKHIKQSGLEYTIVREGVYAEIWNIYAGLTNLDSIAKDEEIDIVVPGDVTARFVSRDDLGEANAQILANLDRYKNKSVVLHGPYATSISDIAKLLQNHTSHKVNLRILPDDDVLAYHLSRKSIGPGTTEAFLRDWLTFFPAMAAGDTDYVDDSIEGLLGRKARGINELTDKLFNMKVTGH